MYYAGTSFSTVFSDRFAETCELKLVDKKWCTEGRAAMTRKRLVICLNINNTK